MTYHIIRAAPPPPPQMHGTKTAERRTMELLGVGDAFNVPDRAAANRAKWARAPLAPKRFSVRKLPDNAGWVVRREA